MQTIYKLLQILKIDFLNLILRNLLQEEELKIKIEDKMSVGILYQKLDIKDWYMILTSI